jgi:hypothetical protein
MDYRTGQLKNPNNLDGDLNINKWILSLLNSSLRACSLLFAPSKLTYDPRDPVE